MNKLLSLAIPALIAGTAAAQSAVVVLPGAYPYPTFPASLPSPAVSYPAPLRIELPAPTLIPGRALVLAPAPASVAVLPSLPVPRIPSRPRVPVFRATPERENVRHPLTGLRVQLREQEAKKPERRQDVLGELFDGRRAPVRPGAVVTLPENDLEREIGVSPEPETNLSLKY